MALRGRQKSVMGQRIRKHSLSKQLISNILHNG